MTTVEQPTPKTSIITLLESNSILRDSNTGGEWINNLDEEIILKDGDALTVRQSMIDTTLANSQLIEVLDSERDITISHGMYLTDSGDGTLAGGNVQPAADIKFSKPANCSPDGQNYILQNQVKDDHLIRLHWVAGLQPSDSDLIKVRPGATNPGLPVSAPAFNLTLVPSENPDTDWFEYTVSSNGGVYVEPTTPASGFPPFPNNSFSPIPAAGNFEGMHAILVTRSNDGVQEFRMYAHGWNPAPGEEVKLNDHIGQIEIVDDINGNHMGYQAVWNPSVNVLDGVTPAQYWVFRYGSSDATVGQPGFGTFFYFLNYDATSGSYGPSTIYRICKALYLLVTPDVPSGLTTYSFTLTHKEYDDDKNVSKFVNFNDWTVAGGNKKDMKKVYAELFGQQNGKYIATPAQVLAQKLPVASTGKNFDRYQYEWQRFEQFPDPRQKSRIVFEPFTYDFVAGISLPPGLTLENSGGIVNFQGVANGPGSPGGRLLDGQIVSAPFPPPEEIGCRLTPRIFETKIRIPADKYTYDALAQTITDELNRVPRIIPSFSNNPDDPTQALNPRGWGPSRLLTSTYELSMQQNSGSDAGTDVRLPQFPGDYVYQTSDGDAALRPPIWLSEDSLTVCQYGPEVTPTANVRWCGAEAVSFIFDDTTQSFQIAQMHSNMYSRLNGGIITRQFIAADVLTAEDQLINTDKNGGIFIAGLQPESLFFDKMKFSKSDLLITQLANNPTVRDFMDTGSLIPANDQNNKLGQALCHTCRLTPGRTITGNFIGASTLIDKRVQVISQGGVIDPTGGNYASVNTAYNLETNTDTPITIRGEGIEAQTDDDPFYQIEITGINNQNIYGATTKNNMIQSMVGKYFTSGNFTTGSSDDSFEYIHKGESLTIRSLKTRILNSDGTPATGLGLNSAVILQLNSTK